MEYRMKIQITKIQKSDWNKSTLKLFSEEQKIKTYIQGASKRSGIRVMMLVSIVASTVTVLVLNWYGDL